MDQRYAAVDGHVFLPRNVRLHITDPDMECRKTGLKLIDLIVKEFVSSIKRGEEQFEDRLAETLRSFLELLKSQYLDNPDYNFRIGGLMALASTALALSDLLSPFADKFIALASSSFSDQEAKVRYYACEAMYNISKRAKPTVLASFSSIFDGICRLCSDIDEDVRHTSQYLNRLICDIVLDSEFPPVDLIVEILASRIFVSDARIRMLIVTWVVTLKALPTVDMLGHLPKIFLGLSNMLVDGNKDVQLAAEACLNDFLAHFRAVLTPGTKVMDEELFAIIVLNSQRTESIIQFVNIVWVREICALQPQVIHFKGFNLFLGCLVDTMASGNPDIRKLSQEGNRILFQRVKETRSLSNVESISSTLNETLERSNNELVISAILEWFCLIFEVKGSEIKPTAHCLCKNIIDCFKKGEAITEETLRAMLLLISLGDEFFELLAKPLLELFKTNSKLLEERGRSIVVKIGEKLGFEDFYKIITQCMAREEDQEFLYEMVDSLNWTLLTCDEAFEFRRNLMDPGRSELCQGLFEIWRNNLPAALALALWTQKYDLARELVEEISVCKFSVKLLVCLDKIVQLLDSHIFVRLRLHLLEPEAHPSLLEALLGLHMILPQSETNMKLIKRLQTSQLKLISNRLQARP